MVRARSLVRVWLVLFHEKKIFMKSKDIGVGVFAVGRGEEVDSPV